MKKTAKLGMGIFGTGMALGAGSIGLSAMGGVPAANAAKGLGNASAMMPAMGSIAGSGMVLGSAKRLEDFYKVRGKGGARGSAKRLENFYGPKRKRR